MSLGPLYLSIDGWAASMSSEVPGHGTAQRPRQSLVLLEKIPRAQSVELPRDTGITLIPDGIELHPA